MKSSRIILGILAGAILFSRAGIAEKESNPRQQALQWLKEAIQMTSTPEERSMVLFHWRNIKEPDLIPLLRKYASPTIKDWLSVLFNIPIKWTICYPREMAILSLSYMDLPLAIKLTKKNWRFCETQRWLKEIARELAPYEPIQALKAIEQIREPEFQFSTLVTVARHFAKTHPEKSRELLERAKSIKAKMLWPDKPSVNIHLAWGYSAFAPIKSMEILKEIQDPGEYVLYFLSLAQKGARQAPELAESLLEKLSDPYDRVQLLAEIHNGWKRIEPKKAEVYLQRALEMAESEQEVLVRNLSLQNTAMIIASADPYTAEDIARKISDPMIRLRTRTTIASIIAEQSPDYAYFLLKYALQDFYTLIPIPEDVESIICSETMDYAGYDLAQIAYALARFDPGEASRLLRVAASMPQPDAGPWYRWILEFMAYIGDEKAFELVQHFQFIENRIKAMNCVALFFALHDVEKSISLLRESASLSLNNRLPARLSETANFLWFIQAGQFPPRHSCGLAADDSQTYGIF